jgi:hypothetical protein
MNTQAREKWIVMGNHRNTWGKDEYVGLPMSDLTTHTCVSGSTGSGKSTFLRGLAKQFFDLGGVVIVIEPHGDLILDGQEGILADLPADMLDRVAVLDFTGPCPPQLNLTTMDLPRGRSLSVDTAMRCIEVVESAGFEKAVRMREILEHTLHLILERSGRGASMLDAQIFLNDEVERKGWLEEFTQSKEPHRQEELGESLPYLTQLFAAEEGGKHKDQPLEYPIRRVGRFFRNEYLRRSLALPLLNPEHAFDLEKLMNSRKGAMILVPLRSDELGDDAKRVIATLLMQTISNIFMARAAMPRAERPQTMVILDEFADLAGTGVGTIVKTLLAQARKFGASIVLATQSLAQLPADVQSEVRTNTNNKIVLRPTDDTDAKAGIANLGTALLKPNDLLNIERWSGYARLIVHGDPQPPFYFQSLPPIRMHRRRQRLRFHTTPERPLHPTLAQAWQMVEADPKKARQAIGLLTDLTPEAFAAVVCAQWEQQAYEKEQLLSCPDLEPDPVERALRISRAQFGLPWWMYEAQYRKLRFKKAEDA